MHPGGLSPLPESRSMWEPEPLPDSDPVRIPEKRDTGMPEERPPSSSARAAAYSSIDPPTIRKAPIAAVAGTGASGGSSSWRVQLVDQASDEVVVLPHAGDRIDIFQLEEAIGVGGMGAVFRALDTRLDRHVALKILPPRQSHDTEVVQRFYQEGRAAARLDHENIARVYSIGRDEQYHYIAFEYIEGTTLRQRVEKNGPLPVDEAINFTLQIGDALVHAAEREVVHRDIKPSNIIITPHGRAKLVDMGLARRFERGGDDGLTQSGMTLGTFDYISPEQARDPRDVDVRSDLYSLGCTLFHMLTGRPPFPEGTVLQKLIQHQEEPPPDVRALNPSVPPDLAGILVKLMAKDRDRRYQTPEQLVRDLLTVAGALGLRSVSPEGLVWLSSEKPRAWERHLVWGAPAFVFLMILTALLWWNQDSTRAPASASAYDATQVETVQTQAPTGEAAAARTLVSRAATAGDAATNQAESSPTASSPTPYVSGTPREIPVESTSDLLAALASAPPRSVILLRDGGPYNLGVGRSGTGVHGPGFDRLVGRDLTIKADAGVRPVLRLARDFAAGLKPRPALLEIAGGHVTLEGLEFVLEPADNMSAIRAEDAELTVRRCVFRRSAWWSGVEPTEVGKVAAVEVRVGKGPTTARDRPPEVVLEKCHFDGAQVGVLASGPVDLTLRDCTLAEAAPAIWVDNARGPAIVQAEVRLRHVSVLAGNGPVLRFEGTEPRVSIEDSVVSPGDSGERENAVALVATDLPDRLIWRGRANLYAHVGTYLRSLGAPLERDPIRDALTGTETTDDIREFDTKTTNTPIWDEPEPIQTLAQEPENPTRAFRLAASVRGNTELGVRQGPFGSVAPAVRVASSAKPSPRASKPSPEPVAAPAPAVVSRPSEPSRPTATETTPRPAETAAKDAPRGTDLPDMPVMPPMARDRDRPAAGETTPLGEATAPVETTNPTPTPSPSVKPVIATPRDDPSVVKSADQFVNVLSDPVSRPGLMRIVADADWELGSLTVRASGSWRIQAEAGKTRPRLRFLPAQGNARASAGWTALFGLHSGSMTLEGFDIVLPRANAPRQERWAVFLVEPGTDLNLVNCTVTIEGGPASSAFAAVTGPEFMAEDGLNFALAEATVASIQANDCLFRVGGDLVDVAAGRRLALELNNVVAATGGSVVHAHGVPRGQAPERLNVTLRQVTVRLGGSLLNLESTEDAPELPIVDVNARDSIFATIEKGTPLIRVDGQDAPATTRDRILWEGHGLAYHQISTYRRDQSAQVGTVPTLYDRPSWVVAVGSRELAAFHGDLKFQTEWDATRPVWTLGRDDARLAEDSPVAASGADLDRIPSPPPS